MPKVFHTIIISILLIFSYADYASAQNSSKLSKSVISGYVLTHEHPVQGMAFGGNYAFTGEAGNYKNGVMEKGYTAMCSGCKSLGKCDHGEVKGNFAAVSGSLGADMGPHKAYKGPLSKSNSHIRYSTEWIKDVFQPSGKKFQDTNAKIMVAFAVENNVMCEQLYYANKGKGGSGGNGYACDRSDSFSSLKRQLDAIKDWVAENNSWMEIAYSSKDARKIILSNKMAIILGIESEYSFGSESAKFNPVSRLNRYYNEGVRTFYLAHKINSRLAGADIFLPKNSTGGKAIRMSQAIAGCFHYDDNIGTFPLVNSRGQNFCDNYNKCGKNAFRGFKFLGLTEQCSKKYSDISEVNFADYVLGKGGRLFNGFNIYPLPPGFVRDAESGTYAGGSFMDGSIERNSLGLSHDGERVIRDAMMKGMIVNIDHVSSKARDHIYDIATNVFDNYPLNALHNKPNAMLADNWKQGVHKHDSRRHEYDLDNDELDYIKNTGGFFGFRMGPTDSKNYPESGITVNCPNTSTESAKMLAWLLDREISVGYSLDYATVTEGVHSRTLENCGLSLSGNRDVIHKYAGNVTEGLSHIGVMKKWHKELEDIGLSDRYLNQLKNDGAEQFLAMWEKSEQASSTGSQIDRIIFPSNLGGMAKCTEKSDCSANEFCSNPVLGKGKCKTLKSQGKICTKKWQCASERCFAGRCAAADECKSNSECSSNQRCGDPIAGKRKCKDLLNNGSVCISKNQCASERCFAGRCAAADECKSNSECSSNQRCGDPIAGKRKCKDLLNNGSVCTSKNQCASERCFAGRCAAADECKSNSECSNNEFCGDPVAGSKKCKALKSKGQACTSKNQCASNRCFAARCAAADECRSSSDCRNNQRCGDPIAGKRKCKDLLANGKTCTSKKQCISGRCNWGKCKSP